MWRSHYETTTNVSAEVLFKVISDIGGWTQWDEEIEWVRIEGDIKAGRCFVLKPKGGPNVRMSVEQIQSPNLLADIAHLPLAKMRTIHELFPSEGGTTVRFTIEIWGILGFFWRKIVGENQIAGAHGQIEAMIGYARKQMQAAGV
ncbi:MAG: hypothetical protein JWQ02_448 [Capsulimonas sp.]|jgi:hypothetical protein|nr:hypothetical protein [Capsulimonas sp.]